MPPGQRDVASYVSVPPDDPESPSPLGRWISPYPKTPQAHQRATQDSVEASQRGPAWRGDVRRQRWEPCDIILKKDGAK